MNGVHWKQEVKCLHNILSLQQKTIALIPAVFSICWIPDDIVYVILQKLHHMLMREFVETMRLFIDGIEADGSNFVSVRTACARQNGMYEMVLAMCKYKQVAFLHLRKLPNLMFSISNKLHELKVLNQKKAQSSRQRQRCHDLAHLSARWKHAFVHFFKAEAV